MPGLRIETGHPDAVTDVALDNFGKRVATAYSDNTIKIIDASGTNSSQLATLTGHQGPVWKVSWSHPKFGSLLASCSYDGRVIIWKENSENEWIQFHVFDDHKSSVNSIAWAPYEVGLSLACGSSDGSISIYTARPDGFWDTIRIDQAHPVGVTSVSWGSSLAPGSPLFPALLDPVPKLVSGGYDGTVKVWALHNGAWTLDAPSLKMHTDCVLDVAWAPSFGHTKSIIASVSEDGQVIIWTKTEGGPWKGKVLKDFEAPVSALSWSPTGNVLAVTDHQNNLKFWKEAADGEWEEMDAREPLAALDPQTSLNL